METLPRLEISCFGPVTVRLDGAPPPADVLWRKHLALLVYLALSPDRRRAREHLLGLVWPEKDEGQARHSLSEVLRRLRVGLGAARLASSGDTVELSGESLEVDALRFDALADRDPAAAAALARGEFLEGFDARDAAPFEEWVEMMRGHYRARVTALLLAAGEKALSGGDLPRAMALARRAAEREPLSEAAARLLMRARGLSGDPAGALQAYHEFVARMQRELSERPGRDIAALAERLRNGRWRAVQGGEPAEAEPPLVGREAIHRTVFEQLAASAAGATRVLVVLGAGGMGRSRLLAECARRAALDGAVAAGARPIESDHDAAWSTLRQLLRGGLALSPGAVGADPASLGVIAHFAPDLADRVSPAEPRDVAQVSAALAALLGAVAEEQPVVLTLDDAHLADGTTLAALHGAVRERAAQPLCVILSAADEIGDWPGELAALARDVGHGVPGITVVLPPLGEPDVLALTLAMGRLDDGEASRRLSRRVSVECGGSPFLAVTLLRALSSSRRLAEDLAAWPPPTQTLDAPLPSGVSAVVRLAILTQLVGLGDAAVRTGTAAALAGVGVVADILAPGTGIGLAETEAALEELERRRVLEFRDGRYVFAAGVVAAVFRREGLPRGQREAIRLRLADALEARDELEWRVAAAALRSREGPSAQAFRVAVEAARAGLAEGARRTARRSLAIAEAAADPSDSAARRTLDDLRRDVDSQRKSLAR